MRRTFAYVKKFICRLRKIVKGRNSTNNADEDKPCVLNIEDIRMQKLSLLNCTKEDIFRIK